MPRTQPIFIGGSPTADKSFVARQLGELLKVPILEIDEFRDEIRELVNENPKEFPLSSYLLNITAEEFWKNRTPQDVMQHEIEESREIWPLIQQKVQSGFNGIFEGVTLLPQLIHESYGSSARAVFLVDQDLDRIKKAVYQRGVWDDAETYPQWIKDLEVQWLPMHAEYFKQEATKFGLPWIQVTNRNTVLDQVKAALHLT